MLLPPPLYFIVFYQFNLSSFTDEIQNHVVELVTLSERCYPPWRVGTRAVHNDRFSYTCILLPITVWICFDFNLVIVHISVRRKGRVIEVEKIDGINETFT